MCNGLVLKLNISSSTEYWHTGLRKVNNSKDPRFSYFPLEINRRSQNNEKSSSMGKAYVGKI